MARARRTFKAGADVAWRMILPALALLVSLSLAPAAYAVDELDKGPRVGQAIPHPLTATDQKGRVRDFRSLTRKRGLIILFTRSLDW